MLLLPATKSPAPMGSSAGLLSTLLLLALGASSSVCSSCTHASQARPAHTAQQAAWGSGSCSLAPVRLPAQTGAPGVPPCPAASQAACPACAPAESACPHGARNSQTGRRWRISAQGSHAANSSDSHRIDFWSNTTGRAHLTHLESGRLDVGVAELGLRCGAHHSQQMPPDQLKRFFGVDALWRARGGT